MSQTVWKIFCTTENQFISGASPVPITTCPNNALHTVQVNSVCVDYVTTIIEDIDATANAFAFTTLRTTQSVNRVLTLPDATDVLVARNTNDSLTNKTIIGSTNTVRATQLATTGSDVIISASVPPAIKF
jgi:hypothetical protein